jgi:DNA-binding response OmpR family regulator
MPPRVLVIDRSAGTRDAVAELLGALADEVAWAPREHAAERLRAAIAAGAAFEVLLLEAEPPPTPALVRELVTSGGGARVVLMATGADGSALGGRVGATDVVARPFNAADLAVVEKADSSPVTEADRAADPGRMAVRRAERADRRTMHPHEQPVVQLAQQSRGRRAAWIGAEHAGHVGPDLQAQCLQLGGKISA